jgi:methylated-DNA-[protein]-cysteine S-methyltransferase
MSISFQKYLSPVGELFLADKDGRLLAVLYQEGWPRFAKKFPEALERETPVLIETRKQLGEYFAGQRRAFELPYELQGTAFQIHVWSALSSIPFGQTRTYKEQAEAISAPSAVRAVGRTNGLNLLSIVLPCHRVIGSNGSLTGYAGGLAAKQYLLQLEAEHAGAE